MVRQEATSYVIGLTCLRVPSSTALRISLLSVLLTTSNEAMLFAARGRDDGSGRLRAEGPAARTDVFLDSRERRAGALIERGDCGHDSSPVLAHGVERETWNGRPASGGDEGLGVERSAVDSEKRGTTASHGDRTAKEG